MSVHATLLPNADVSHDFFFNDEDTSSLYDHLHGGGHFIELGRRMVKGPIRLLLLTTDDGGRFPIDHVAKVTTCVDSSRVGTLARRNFKTRIMDLGTNFTRCRTDHTPCSPGRAAFMNGLRAPQHGNTKVSTDEYFQLIRDGMRTQQVFDLSQGVRGPIERDCAIIAAEAFFADVNQSAAAWNSGTAYVVGNCVKQAFGGQDHFYIANLNNTNKSPVNNCTSPTDEWRHYGTLAAATAMRAQQPIGAAVQPFSGDLDSTKRRRSWYGRIKGSPGAALEDDLQLTGNTVTWLTTTNRVKAYGLEKYQNGVGLINNSDTYTPYNSADPDYATAPYWAAGTWTAGQQVAYHGRFYTCSTNVTSSTSPAADTTHWTAGDIANTTRFVSPGFRRFVMSADDDQDHYRNYHIDFDELVGGPNPPTGLGQIGVRSFLRYDYELSSLSYSSGTGKVTAVTIDATDLTSAGLTVGGTATISVDYSFGSGGSHVPFGGTNWVEPEITATIVDAHTFTYTPTATPTGTPNVSDGFLYVRNLFEPIWYANTHVAMLDDVSDFDNLFVYHGFHMPHWSTVGTGGTRDDVNTQNERKYENSQYSSVPLSQAFGWNGVLGAKQPSISVADGANTGTTSARRHWASRNNMFASQDDALGIILDAWDARFGEGTYYIVCVDDNGYQYGSHADTELDANAPVGGKIYNWENSVRISCYIRGPQFAQGAQDSRLVELADIPMTILDIFQDAVPELVGHHAHTKRDGDSILRKMSGDAPARPQLCMGKYLQAGAGSEYLFHPKIIMPDGNALVRLWNFAIEDPRLDQQRKVFLGDGAGAPDEGEDETIDHQNDSDATRALTMKLSKHLYYLMVGRYDVSLGAHTGKTSVCYAGAAPARATGRAFTAFSAAPNVGNATGAAYQASVAT